MVHRTLGLGVFFALISLLLLAFMPIIAIGRPQNFDVISFVAFLSIWQLVFSLPVLGGERLAGAKGVFCAKISKPMRSRTLVIILSTGLIFALSTLLYVFAIEKTGPVNAAIAMQAYPLFAIFLETVFLGKKKSKLELLFTAILLLILFFLATKGTLRFTEISVWFLLALAVPFLWSIAHIIIREVMTRTPITPAQITFFRVLIGSVSLGAFAILMVGTERLWAIASSGEYQIAAMIMGLVYYLELMAWFYAVKWIDVSLASCITIPWPAGTMVLAAIFLGDSIEVYQVGAFFVIAITLYCLIFVGARQRASRGLG